MGKCDETNVEMSMGDSASPLKQDIFSFTVPPEAPVFAPTAEEFQDPLAYISKIKPIAEKCGICKIKPPVNWQPPFAVDVDRLRFTPRIQRLNELEAITRVKLNFLDQIAKFWELQGTLLKIPTVERKPLDLYSLHKIVNEAGGYEVCSAERKWSKIAVRMGHPQGKGVGTILKNHYEKILFPYDLFKSGESIDVKPSEIKGEMTPEKANMQGACKRGSSAQKNTSNNGSQAAETKPIPTRRWKKLNELDEQEGTQTEGCLGSGDSPPANDRKKDLRNKTPSKQEVTTILDEKKTPVKESPSKRRMAQQPISMASCPHSVPSSRSVRSTTSRSLQAQRQDSMTVNVVPAQPDSADPLAKYICHNCGRGDVEEQMLLCDGCDDSYHTFCLMPPLDSIPKGDWRCPPCIAQEVSKPTEAFGFEQAQREYSLQQFGEMADQFKSEYFNMPVHMVPTQTVEKEFWRIVSSIDEDVTVEYGADLHCMDHGSGFPTKSSKHLYPGDQEYADSSWNLNNLPLLEGSVLGHINADISGMKVPWMYVGMCFSTFCWHNEDHWSYSINYMHWGEPKTWYGVPGSKAELFETTMRSAAPELFHWQPDLLHQLVTIMNPNILMQAEVPVYRTDQNAGEFVITFPRAYHAGFNQGYNFAEAVNFTPADWLKIGRDCIDHYSKLRRYCVFSHDELVCKMALEADKLEATVALATYQDMRTMLSQERKLRKSLLEWGVTEAEREAFELLPDDERQCIYCKTTCFLSAVTCPCADNLVCLRHYTELCQCPPTKHKLRYRFTLDELPSMLEKLKRRSEAVKEWADAVNNALDPTTPKSCDLEGLRGHYRKGYELKMHKSDIVRALAAAIEAAEKCASVIHQLDLNKMRTRTRHSADLKYKLTVEELTLFCEEIDGLACVLPEGSAVKEVLRQTVELEKLAESLLVGEPGSTPGKIRDMEQCVERGSALCIQLPKLTLISNRLQQEKFLDEVKMHREEYDTLNLETINKLLEQGLKIQPHYVLETQLALLQKLKTEVEKWEEKAKTVLTPTGDHQSLEDVEKFLKSADKIEAYLPSRQHLNTAFNNAKEWLKKVEEMQSKDSYPYFSTLEGVVKKGQTINISLYEKDMLSEALSSAKVWKEKTSRTFLKKGWLQSLMEALSPRTDVSSGAKRCVSQPPPTPPSSQTGRGRGHHNNSTADRNSSTSINNNTLNNTTGNSASNNLGSSNRPFSPVPSTVEAEHFLKCFSEERSPKQIVAAFKAAEEREMGNMRELRSRNLRKDIRMPQQGVTYCYCFKRQYGIMTQCDLCKEWYHTSCINSLPLNESETPPGRFLCPGCVRTKRPRLEVILGLLVALQKLPVRLAEGEALQCLTERSMAWQDRARALLATKEAAKGLALIAQAESGQGGSRDKFDKMMSNRNSKGGALSPSHDNIQNRNSSASEHAYSASPPANVGSPPAGSSANATSTRTVRLSSQLLHRLEDLMMEGDLLEVTMAETSQMWSLLRGARDHSTVWSERGSLGSLTDISANNGSMNESNRESPVKRVSSATHQQQLKRVRRTKDQQQMLMMMQSPGGGAGTSASPGSNNTGTNLNKSFTVKKMRKSSPAAPRRASAPAPTATNYLNRKQQSVAGGSGLMMKKHFLAKQERRRRGITTKQSTRGRRAGVPTKMKRAGGAESGGLGRSVVSPNQTNSSGLLGRSASPQSDNDSSHASSNEDEEDCAASTCLRPTGKEVDWVQCDGGCEKWFHLHCVGLSKNSLKDDEDYYCSICSNGVSGKKANKPKEAAQDVTPKKSAERVKEERATKNSSKQSRMEMKKERQNLETKRFPVEEPPAVKKTSLPDGLLCEEKMVKDESNDENSKLSPKSISDVKMDVDDLVTDNKVSNDDSKTGNVTDSVEKKDS